MEGEETSMPTELRLQLFPCDDDIAALMSKHGHNPKLQ